MSSQPIALKSALRRTIRLLASVLSVRYLLLRYSTAGAAVINGLVQTFVFARVLTPKDFSIFILVATFGASLWLFDLGAGKILFVRQRERHLGRHADNVISSQSSAVVILYLIVVLIGTALCFAAMAIWGGSTLGRAAELAAFFSFSALNLVWYPLRNVSNAVDEFVYFETLDAVRRVGHIAVTLALLLGLTMPAFLIAGNLIWAAVFAACIIRLFHKRALAFGWRLVNTLAAFWRTNRRDLLRSGNYALGEMAIYNFPYLVVPLAFGLGAPTIILDTVFKIFRGATLMYAAGLDPLTPRQTRAFAERDATTLRRATLIAAFFCVIPTLVLCAVLLLAGDRLFALLLGHAATMPRPVVFILAALLLTNAVQNVASNLLLYTGFFREIARLASVMVIAMAVMTAIAVAAGAGIIGFMAGYTTVSAIGAALYLTSMLRGPFRMAAASPPLRGT